MCGGSSRVLPAGQWTCCVNVSVWGRRLLEHTCGSHSFKEARATGMPGPQSSSVHEPVYLQGWGRAWPGVTRPGSKPWPHQFPGVQPVPPFPPVSNGDNDSPHLTRLFRRGEGRRGAEYNAGTQQWHLLGLYDNTLTLSLASVCTQK